MFLVVMAFWDAATMPESAFTFVANRACSADMSDGMPGGTRAPMIAIGAAVAALVTSLIAVIVVANRTDKPGSQAGPLEQRVAAADVAKLKRDSVENVTDTGKVLGVKVIDTKVREALGLEADDIITGIAGRTIKREFDVYDAVLGMSMMDTSVVYVDLIRDKKPMLVRWQLDGDLRSARRSDDSYGSGRGTPPIRGGIGSTAVDPFGVATPRDPLLDTITKVDEFHYEIPRSTIERIVANSTDYMKGARVVPSMKNGAPEGFKLYAIRPTSVWSAVGFQNGDTIRAVNGFETDSIDKAAEIYTKVKDAKELAIDITRRGRYELLTITIK
jgi:S1-C subfamily serine protease